MEQTVLIIGASKGIGSAIGNHLQSKGCRVIGTSRFPDKVNKNELHFPLIAMDVREDDSVNHGLRIAIEEHGYLDAVIINSGYGLAGAIEDTSIDEAKGQFETNFFGIHRTVRAILPHFRSRLKGAIIITGSIAGRLSLPFQPFYSASKFALEGYAEALRLEVAPFGIRISIIEPGDTKSDFGHSRLWTQATNGSPYEERAKNGLAMMVKSEENGADPVGVARTVERALRSSSPQIRYPVGFDALAVTLGIHLLPAKVLQWALKVYYRL